MSWRDLIRAPSEAHRVLADRRRRSALSLALSDSGNSAFSESDGAAPSRGRPWGHARTTPRAATRAPVRQVAPRMVPPPTLHDRWAQDVPHAGRRHGDSRGAKRARGPEDPSPVATKRAHTPDIAPSPRAFAADGSLPLSDADNVGPPSLGASVLWQAARRDDVVAAADDVELDDASVDQLAGVWERSLRFSEARRLEFAQAALHVQTDASHRVALPGLGAEFSTAEVGRWNFAEDGSAQTRAELARLRHVPDVALYPTDLRALWDPETLAAAARARLASMMDDDDDDVMGAAPLALDREADLLLEATEALGAEDLRSRTLRPAHEVDTADPRAFDVCAGMRYYELLFEVMDRLGVTRSPDQAEFHKAIFETCAPHIIGAHDFMRVRDKLLRELGRETEQMGALLTTPRRFGKTECCAMAAAGMMYVCRGVDILVFSTGQKISSAFMQRVKHFYKMLDPEMTRRTVDNVTEFSVRPYDGSLGHRLNTLVAVAATVQHNKGRKFDVCFVDEAARVPKIILSEVIAPMLKVSNAVVVLLSTNMGRDNFFSEMIESEDPLMERLFFRKKIELVCAECKLKERGAEDCPHLAHLHPPWLLDSNADRVKVLMGNDPEMYKREVLGMICGDQNVVFDQRLLKALETRPDVRLTSSRGCFITTYIDPSGGGAGSNVGVVSVARRQDGSTVVVGLAETASRELATIGRDMGAYFGKFRRHPVLGCMRHFLVVEHNFGGDPLCDLFATVARRALPKVDSALPSVRRHGIEEIVREGGAHGVITTNYFKACAVMTCAQQLHQGLVFFATDCIDIHDDEAVATRAQFLDQLGRLRKQFTGSGAVRYSAKTKQGGRDDMAIAFLLAQQKAYTIALNTATMAARR